MKEKIANNGSKDFKKLSRTASSTYNVTNMKVLFTLLTTRFYAANLY